jgi:hypothetical protein
MGSTFFYTFSYVLGLQLYNFYYVLQMQALDHFPIDEY